MKPIIYLLLLTAVFSDRLKNHVNTSDHYNMLDETVRITRNEHMKHYIENPNVYGVDLFLVKDGVDSKVKNLNTQKDEEGIDTSVYDGTNSCHPIERFLNIKEVIKMELFNETATRFFTDMSVGVNGTNKLIYLVEEDYKVHKVALHYKFNRIHQAQSLIQNTLDVGPYITNHMMKNNILFKLHKGMSKFVKNSEQSDYRILITQYGAVILRIKENTMVDFIPMKNRKRISNILLQDDRLYVAAGSEGLDVYSFYENELNIKIEYLQTIDHTSMTDRTEVNILDVKEHIINQTLGSSLVQIKTLVLLEEVNGLYFFKLENNEYNLVFQIQFPRAKAFALYQDTFMVIAETVNKIEYVAEIFVNVQSQEYYFNRVYIEDTAFLHIEMTHQYAILISEDDHLIMEHGIYNGFTHKYKEFVSSFEEEELVKFIWLQKETMSIRNRNEEVDYYLGLARGEVKIYEVYHKNPALYCIFNQNGVYEYKVRMNSSQCDNQFQYNDPYNQCLITQTFKVIVDDSIFDSNNLNSLFWAGVGILALFIVLGALLFICNRSWNLKVFKLQKDLNEKRYLSLGDQDQSQQMRDTSNILGSQI